MKLFFFFILGFNLLSINIASRSFAQVIPSNSIKNKSIVSKDRNTINIIEGQRNGRNLFHSFRKFSIKGSEIVNFKQDNIDFIFTRVTSRIPSNIDGTINIIGDGKLIFINPNGINFGENTQIISNQPVIFSTASRIVFNDALFSASQAFKINNEFSESSNFSLQFQNTRPINVVGNGVVNSLNSPETVPFTSIITNSILNPARFSTSPKTVLIGNSINLDGALLNTTGQLRLISIESGSISYSAGEFDLINSELSDINLSNRSQIESLGEPFQGIIIDAKNVFLSNSSSIIGTNLGGTSRKEIEINSDRLFLSGITDLNDSGIIDNSPEFLFTNTFDSSIRAQNLEGDGIGISINSNQIFLENFSSIALINDSSGTSGDLNISSSEINIDGQPPLPFLPTAISLQNIQGNIGDINIKSEELTIQNGGFLTSINFSSDSQVNLNSGDINLNIGKINVTGEVLLDASLLPVSSSIATTTESTTNSGDIRIRADSINLTDHGLISTNSIGTSRAGDININTKELQIKGTNEEDVNQSGIFARSIFTNSFFDPESLILGESGNVNIDAKNIFIADSGQIAASSIGIGNAGNISLNAERIDIKNLASVLASTAGGNGGSIGINSKLFTVNSGDISASSMGLGVGGNIDITSSFLALNNASIQANADQNQAGQLDIQSQALISSNGSEITASSQLGPQFDGSIEINQNQNQINIPNNKILTSASSQLSFDTCSSDGSTLSQHGSGQHFNTIRDKQLYAEGLKQRLAIANQFTYTDSNGEEKPFRRWLGVQQKEDGELEMVFSPEQSKVLQNLLSSDTSRCINRS